MSFAIIAATILGAAALAGSKAPAELIPSTNRDDHLSPHASRRRRDLLSEGIAAGATVFRADLPDAEIHLLDAGHFALDEKNDEIAALILSFMAKHLPASASAEP